MSADVERSLRDISYPIGPWNIWMEIAQRRSVCYFKETTPGHKAQIIFNDSVSLSGWKGQVPWLGKTNPARKQQIV